MDQPRDDEEMLDEDYWEDEGTSDDFEDMEPNSEEEEIEEMLQEEAMTSEKAESDGEGGQNFPIEIMEDEPEVLKSDAEPEEPKGVADPIEQHPGSSKQEKRPPATPLKSSKSHHTFSRRSGRYKNRSFKGYPKSYMNSSPRKIVRAYKRRAIVKHVPVGRILESSTTKKKVDTIKFAEDSDSSDISIDREDPLQNVPSSTSLLNSKLVKCWTTLKRIPINEEPSIEIVKGPPVVLDPLVNKKKIVFKSKEGDDTVKVVKVVHKPEPLQEYRFPSIPKIRDVKTRNINLILNKPSISAPAPKNVKVVLQKSSNGTYSFVTNGKILPPESFPKAIVYPQYEKQKELKSQEPSTSAQAAVRSIPQMSQGKISFSEPTSITSQSGSSRPSPVPQPEPAPMEAEDLFMIDDDDDEESSPAPPPRRIIVKKFPEPMKQPSPEPFKYIIPQCMLMAQNDRLKIVDENSSSSNSSDNPESCENGDLFVIDQDVDGQKSPPSPPSSVSNSRRKSSLVPLSTDDEPVFEEPFRMPSRPQTNVDLIDSLAKCRVLVRSMLKKLNMPQIDFSTTEGDEYVNMYKMLRN